VLGDLTFRHLVLQVADQPDQTLVTFWPDDDDDDRLRQLAASLP
jgi:hypothetical protein